MVTIKARDALENHKREPIYVTKGFVFTIQSCSFQSLALSHALIGAHGSTAVLSIPISLFLCINHDSFTPYDWQKHPHAWKYK